MVATGFMALLVWLCGAVLFYEFEQAPDSTLYSITCISCISYSYYVLTTIIIILTIIIVYNKELLLIKGC